jgi:hypothetical protein
MALKVKEEDRPLPSATGAAGPSLRINYCTSSCYEAKHPAAGNACGCKGCNGNAHGRGRQYAFDHGYLKDLTHGVNKPKPGQMALIFEDDSDGADVMDQASKNNTCT